MSEKPSFRGKRPDRLRNTIVALGVALGSLSTSELVAAQNRPRRPRVGIRVQTPEESQEYRREVEVFGPTTSYFLVSRAILNQTAMDMRGTVDLASLLMMELEPFVRDRGLYGYHRWLTLHESRNPDSLQSFPEQRTIGDLGRLLHYTLAHRSESLRGVMVVHFANRQSAFFEHANDHAQGSVLTICEFLVRPLSQTFESFRAFPHHPIEWEVIGEGMTQDEAMFNALREFSRRSLQEEDENEETSHIELIEADEQRHPVTNGARIFAGGRRETFLLIQPSMTLYPLNNGRWSARLRAQRGEVRLRQNVENSVILRH